MLIAQWMPRATPTIMKIQSLNYSVAFHDVCYEIHTFASLLSANFIGLIAHDSVLTSKYSRRSYRFPVSRHKDALIHKAFIDQFIPLFNWLGQLMTFFIPDRKSSRTCISQKFCVNIYRRAFPKGKCICRWVSLVTPKKNTVMTVYELKIQDTKRRMNRSKNNLNRERMKGERFFLNRRGRLPLSCL